MPYIPYLKTALHLYAVADRDLIAQAIRGTFSACEMKIHSNKDQIYRHFPGGMLDRGMSAYMNIGVGGTHEADVFQIEQTFTSNQAVCLIGTFVSLKTSSIRRFKAKKQAKIENFHATLMRQFSVHGIPLVAKYDWQNLITEHPEFRCSPAWK